MKDNNLKKLLGIKPIDRYFSISFVAIVLVLGFFSVAGLRAVPVSLLELVSGNTAKAIEAEYDERFVIKQFGTNAWAAIEYRLFKEGRAGVIVGKGGWLFSDEEFQDPPAQQQALAKNIAYISWTRQQLLARNIRLLVVPIPAKARVYRENIGSKQPSVNHQSLYGYFMAALKRENVQASDSLQAMQQYKERNKQLLSKSLYLPTDTHWSAEGASVIAKQAALTLRGEFSHIELAEKVFITEKIGEKLHQGDLISFLPLSPWFNQLLPKTDQITVYKTFSRSTEDNLFADNTISVALVGTSYSASSNWNFAGWLKHSLSADLLNFSEPGRGPMEPMVNFLEQQLENFPYLALVIWEIPERYLQVAYHQAYTSMNATAEFIVEDTLADARIANVELRTAAIIEPLSNAGYRPSSYLIIKPKENIHETSK